MLASALPARAQTVADERLNAIAARYFAQSFKADPVTASLQGMHDGDDDLGDYSARGFRRRAAFTRRAAADLAALDPAGFSPDVAYDAEIFRGRLALQSIALEERPVWRHDPGMYLALVARAAHSLLDRDYAPASIRVRALIAREHGIPGMLAEAARNLTAVDVVTAEQARAELAGTLAFYDAAVPAAVAELHDPALTADFEPANANVLTALERYRGTLEAVAAHSSGTFAVGADLFTRMLRLEELDPTITVAEVERIATAALERTRADFALTARKIDPHRTPAAVVLALGAEHPSAAGLLARATDDVTALRRFVEAHRLVSLPPAGETELRVAETPVYARTTIFASVSVPGPLERRSGVAYFDITPAEPDWTASRKEQHLAFFNDYSFPLIAAHEVMPGHLVNLELDRRERLSPVRRLLASRSFLEGWAHYSEQMLVDEGWGGGDPKVRLAQLQLALQRECRFVVAIRMHTQGMAPAEATRFFMENAYLEEEPARREALRVTQDPMIGAYFLGKLEILKLRDDYRAKVGPAKFTLLDFHNALLAHGAPPLAIVRKILLGAGDDGRLF